MGARHKRFAFEDEQHAALRIHSLNREIENHRKQLQQRLVFGKHLTGANQRLHGRRGFGPAFSSTMV